MEYNASGFAFYGLLFMIGSLKRLLFSTAHLFFIHVYGDKDRR